MKDFKSVLLLLLSLALIGTWFFHFYEKGQYANEKEKRYIKDSASISQLIAQAVKDSVQKISITKNEAADSTDQYSDSLKAQLNNSLGETISLKKEIDDILKNDQATQADLAKSRRLIDELNNRIDKLNAENRLLQAQRIRKNSNNLQNDASYVKEPSTILQKRTTRKYDSIFMVSDIKLSAVSAQVQENETSSAGSTEADKFIFSFILRNDALSNSYYDVYIVITGPGNKVLQTDQWSAADNFFISKKEGKRAFTKRIRFEYNSGDEKKIISSVEPDKIPSGIYTMKIYYNGVVIGQTSRPIG